MLERVAQKSGGCPHSWRFKAKQDEECDLLSDLVDDSTAHSTEKWNDWFTLCLSSVIELKDRLLRL